MPKGLSRLLLAALLLVASSGFNTGVLHAQVYRCETASGVTFSDMPCGDSAEQIEVAGDVMDSRGVGSSMPTEAEGVDPLPAANGAQDPQQGMQQFLATLETQREQQLSQIDAQLRLLRDQYNSDEFTTLESTQQDAVRGRISELESQRADLEREYASLIAEAIRRLELE